MSPSFTMDNASLDRFQAALKSIIYGSDKPLETLVDQQGGLFTLDLMKYTPPVEFVVGQSVSGMAFATQKKLGENAVRRDLKKLFQPLDSLDVFKAAETKPHLKHFKTLRESKQYEQLSEALYAARILPFKCRIVEYASGALHSQSRDKRGRVKKDIKHPFMVDNALSLEVLIKEKVGQVGKGKGGWNKAAEMLRVSVPRWISKWRGGYFDSKKTANGYYITVGNDAPHIAEFGREKRIVELALNARAGAMERSFRNLLEKRSRRAGF